MPVIDAGTAVQRTGLRHAPCMDDQRDRSRPWPADHLTLIKKDKKYKKNYPVMLD